MATKQIFTDADIEKDIINALRNPPRQTKSSDTKTRIAAVIIACELLVIEIIHPYFVFWLLIAFAPCVIMAVVFKHLILKYRIEKVNILDYRITTEVVKDTAEETYVIRHRRRNETVTYYSICFENGKIWRIPTDNHQWSERYRMSNQSVFQSTHRGDTMTVVTKRLNDTVVMAYNTEFFEYKNNY